MKLKKISAIMAIAMLAVLMFTACADKKETNSGENAEKKPIMNTQLSAENESGAEDEADLKETPSETDIEEQTQDMTESQTEEQTEEQTEAETEAETDYIYLNPELKYDYGAYFDDLKEKYGNITHFVCPEGGVAYRFERGYAYYICGDCDHTLGWVEDDAVIGAGSGDGGYIAVRGDNRCYSMQDIKFGDFIYSSYSELTLDQFVSIPGLNYIGTSYGESLHVWEPCYHSVFTYDGFNNENTIITIFHEDENVIKSTEKVNIFTHPMDYPNGYKYE